MKFFLERFKPNKESLKQFRQKHEVDEVFDTYEDQLKELFFVQNPKYRFIPDFHAAQTLFIKNHCKNKSLDYCGNWFYFPWNKQLVHFLPEILHQQLRTARNRELITLKEQQKFYNSVVAVAGLSVGSHAALNLAMTGGAKVMKLADFDVISVSNLNRIKAPVSAVGKKKAIFIAQQIAELNPYSELYIYSDGVTEKNIAEFIDGSPKVPATDILIEQIDSIKMKFELRLKAKTKKIPVLMATDIGDGGLIDIERYDVDKNLKPFHGLLGNLTLADVQSIPPSQMIKWVAKIIGADNLSPKTQDSLLSIGKSIYSWPQLGTAAACSGAILAYASRAILTKLPIKSGRYHIEPAHLLEHDYFHFKNIKLRKIKTSQFKKILDLI